MALRLDWAAAPERFANSVLAHRAAVLGRGEAKLTHEGYLVDASLAGAAHELGLAPVTCDGDDDGRPIGMPRVALFRGQAIGYPYYAYYAHCLTSLGLTYLGVDGPAVAAGALDAADLLVMPGGFATWGLDRAEEVAGVDMAIRRFIERGGAFIGSCGGAFYLSHGRPGWLGLIDAKPKYTHEYLQTGAGVVNVRLTDASIRGALPDRLELAYYHGPAFPGDIARARTLGVFEGFAMASRLFIDNPLDRERFERDLAGTPAILLTDPAMGRALAFSPHPEMGDFVRKGISLDGYVRRYLPIRGEKTMDETLRFYGGEDSLSFRLVLNAMIALDLFAERPAARGPARADAGELALLRASLDEADTAWRDGVVAVSVATASQEEPGLASLVGRELDRRGAEWRDILAAWRGAIDSGRVDALLVASLRHVLADASLGLRGVGNAELAHRLVLLELPVRLAAAAGRIARCDHLLEAMP